MRDWQTENGFMKHHCPQRDRLEELKSARGQTAYAMYSEWMRLQKRSVPPADTFLISKQYKHFVNFVDWADKTAIPDPMQFVKIMVDTDTQPVLWCRHTTYALYLQWYDNMYPPEQQFVDTLDRLGELALDIRCDIVDVYFQLGPDEIARLVRRRKLSPWLLVVSTRFLKYVATLPAPKRDMLNEAINFGAYAAKIKANPKLAAELRGACDASNV